MTTGFGVASLGAIASVLWFDGLVGLVLFGRVVWFWVFLWDSAVRLWGLGLVWFPGFYFDAGLV